jgi:hypothetical protein
MIVWRGQGCEIQGAQILGLPGGSTVVGVRKIRTCFRTGENHPPIFFASKIQRSCLDIFFALGQKHRNENSRGNHLHGVRRTKTRSGIIELVSSRCLCGLFDSRRLSAYGVAASAPRLRALHVDFFQLGEPLRPQPLHGHFTQ